TLAGKTLQTTGAVLSATGAACWNPHTRSVGFMFATLGLSLSTRLFDRPTVARTSLCAVLSASALAAHMELGLFVAYSLLLLAITHKRRVHALSLAALLLVLMVAVSSPWWLTVLGRHGLAPFDAASLTSGWSSPIDRLETLERYLFLPGPFFGVLGASALLGVIICIIRGQLFLPLWPLVVFLMTPRSAESEGALPLARDGGQTRESGTQDLLRQLVPEDPGGQVAVARLR
ncbi:MAG TPA: hypothetical protein VHS06_05220, partial [Chloroflexota bacterium]|nr:hypothetical protein [Chloroflexota bacterium]